MFLYAQSLLQIWQTNKTISSRGCCCFSTWLKANFLSLTAKTNEDKRMFSSTETNINSPTNRATHVKPKMTWCIGHTSDFWCVKLSYFQLSVTSLAILINAILLSERGRITYTMRTKMNKISFFSI